MKAGEAASLTETHPALAAQWDGAKNELSPADVSAGSHARVWWTCDQGPDHRWQATVYQRTASPSCPFCTGRRACLSTSLAGQEDDVARRLVREWHPEKNAPLTPRDVVPGSNRRFWWRCELGHEWETTLANRYRLKAGCPYCSGRYAAKERSLAVTHPELSREWDADRNGALTPETVLPGSEKKVWWRCPRDRAHSYQARVAHRTKVGTGCPFCSNRRLTPERSLGAQNPELAKQWHPTKNGELRPEDVAPGSGRRVWWRCELGHEWQTMVANRPRTGCPFCSNRRVDPKETVATMPALIAQWHPTMNVPLTPHDVSLRGGRAVFWICSHGADHVWRDSPRNRVRDGIVCPFCAKRRASSTYSLARVRPKLARQWHPERNGGLTPADVVPGSGKQVWWRCAEGHEWRATVEARARRHQPTGCPYCSNKKTAPERSLAAVSPELAAEWHPTRNGSLEPSDVVPGSNKRVWWKCGSGPDHEWQSSINNRARRGDGCPFCAGRRASVTNSLARLHPRLARQWHPEKNGDLTPHDVPSGSAKRAWWTCAKGEDHEWQARVEVRVRYPRCPFCIGVRVSVTNSLAGLFPAIAREWHPSKNDVLKPSEIHGASQKTVWWRCPRRHSYAMTVRARTVQGRACPVCAGEAPGG